MSYDRDIFWARMAAFGLVVGNAVAAIMNLVAHNWVVGIACFIWLYNSLMLIWSSRLQQRTRDQGRVIQAGLDAMRQEIDAGEY